ncbi:MAG: hypothetical protein ACRD10_12620 [Terriglobia bacterium]
MIMPMLLLQAHHKVIQIIGRDASSGGAVGKAIEETIEDGFVLRSVFGFFKLSTSSRYRLTATYLFFGSGVALHAQSAALQDVFAAAPPTLRAWC